MRDLTWLFDGELVADEFNDLIRKITKEENVSTFAGSNKKHYTYEDGKGVRQDSLHPVHWR